MPETPKSYTKKPVTIEAIVYDGTNQNAIKAFTQGGCFTDVNDPKRPKFMIRTLEGEHIASVGDYIIKGVKGEFYPCRADIFELTYSPQAAAVPARQGAVPDKEKETEMSEQPVFTLLYRRTELMPDGSIGAVFIGEFGGDRSKDLRLTVAQAQTLADQITQKIGNHTIFEQGAPRAGK